MKNCEAALDFSSQGVPLHKLLMSLSEEDGSVLFNLAGPDKTVVLDGHMLEGDPQKSVKAAMEISVKYLEKQYGKILLPVRTSEAVQ